jgi:hypothetical protein
MHGSVLGVTMNTVYKGTENKFGVASKDGYLNMAL